MNPRVILITGSSSGFGRGAAEALLARGHTVIATMRDPAGRNSAAAQTLREAESSAGGTLHVLELDVTDDASVDRAFADAVHLTKSVDVVINNAGIWGPGALEAYEMDQWQALFDVNLFGSVRVFRAILPLMRARKKGLVVQVSSLQGRFVLPYSGPYVASKFAVEGMAETFRAEIAPFGVEVSIIEPFDYMTEMKLKARDHVARNEQIQAAYGVSDFIEAAYLRPDPQRVRDPLEVVEALVRLVETPDGKRPFRLTVGNPLVQIEDINRLTDEMHAALYPMIGLDALAPRLPPP